MNFVKFKSSWSSKNFFFKILFLAFVSFFLQACPEKPVEPQPCEGKEPVTADFKIFQAIPDYFHRKTVYIEHDTALVGGTVYFEAIENYDYYEWQLGDDTTLYKSKSTSIRFEKAWGDLLMRLVVRSKPDLECFPNDDGVDTVYKKITIIPYRAASIFGTYLGYHTSDTLDTFSVNIYFGEGDRGIVMDNINRGYILPKEATLNIVTYTFSNTAIYFEGRDNFYYGCESPSGSAILQADRKTIVIEYESGRPNNRKKYKFIGVKK